MTVDPPAGSRVRLRQWQPTDHDAFVDLNTDPQVMETIGPVMDAGGAEAFLSRIQRHFDEHGFGLWCIDLDGESIGFCGLMVPWFRDGVEIGWRLRSKWWGNGYASESARCVLAHAFSNEHGGLGFDEVISFTAEVNVRSQHVMRAIGMEHDANGDFEHPGVPETSHLRPHVLYRLSVGRYRSLL